MDAILSRWTNHRKKNADGTPINFHFGELDLDICKLLSPVKAREPWGYRFLPTRNIAALTGRPKWPVQRRLRKLCWPPSYIEKPDQPHNNYRDIIYSIGKAGVAELQEAGFHIPVYRARKLAHELMACMIAASFELSVRDGGIIEPSHIRLPDDLRPDWPLFRYVTPHHDLHIAIEADTGSEGLDVADKDATDIRGKLEHYLKVIHDQKLHDLMVCFYVCIGQRVHSIPALLRKVIDEGGYDHDYARQFCVMHIPYDRFLNKLPTATTWAVTDDYHRAVAGRNFNFLKKETW